MNRQRTTALLTVIVLLASLGSACGRGEDKAVKGRNGPNGAAHDTVSDLSLNEDGLGQIQIGMNLDDAVNMGLLNENPTMNKQCDFVFPAVGAGIPEGVSAMVVRGKIARIDVDTGTVTTEDCAKIGDTEDKIKSIYGNDVTIEAGMVINIETPYYEFGIGAIHVENPFVVSESGPNVLLTSGSPRELVVLS